MIILEIVLIVIGLLAVGLSFRVSDQRSDAASGPAETGHQEQAAQLREELEQLREELEQYQEESLQSVSEELSRLSNDKILGMDEYSSQVLERMNKNHEEVVFLYNMLNEKEEEIKALVHHVDSIKAQIHDETAQEYQKMMEALRKLQEHRGLMEQQETKQRHEEKPALESTQAQHLAESARELSGRRKAETEEKAETVREHNASGGSLDMNHNQEIIALYKKGHSVLEISKLLSLGQGEVKFVIDLFENR